MKTLFTASCGTDIDSKFEVFLFVRFFALEMLRNFLTFMHLKS